MKLALIIDNSEPVADFRADLIFEKWGTEPKSIKRAERFVDAGKPSLFSSDVATRLYLTSTDAIRQMTKILTEAKGEPDFIHSGFLMVAPGANRNATKKMEKLITDIGGEVIASKAKDGTSTVETMLSELSLSPDVKGFLKDHTGSSVEKLIPIYRTVHTLSPKQQSGISVEDILIRISPKAGEIPPWEIEEHLFSKNTTKAIETARRVMLNSHPVLVVSILKTSFSRLHRIRFMLSAGVSDRKDIMKATGNMSPGQAGFLTKRANRLTLAQTTKMVQAVADCEDNIKGKEPTDAYANIEIMLTKIVAALSQR